MGHLFIDADSLGTAGKSLFTHSHFAHLSRNAADGAPMGPGYSRASGFDQLGTIHGLSMTGAPGAAAEVLRQLDAEIGTIRDNLGTTRGVVLMQDAAAALAFDVVDMGGAINQVTETFTARDNTGTSPLYKAPVTVIPDPAVSVLLGKLQSTDTAAATESQSIWSQISELIGNISGGMWELANYVLGQNQGATPEAIATRLQNVGTRTGYISDNSAVFATSLSGLEAARAQNTTMVSTVQSQLDLMRASGPKGVAAAEVVEKAFLGYYTVATQGVLTGLIPPVVNLTLPDRANPGGDAVAGMSDVDGTGTRYFPDGMLAPVSVLDDVAEARRMFPEAVDVVNQVTRGMADDIGGNLGEGLLSPSGITTEAATVGAPSAPLGQLAGMSPSAPGGAGGWNPGTAGVSGFVPGGMNTGGGAGFTPGGVLGGSGMQSRAAGLAGGLPTAISGGTAGRGGGAGGVAPIGSPSAIPGTAGRGVGAGGVAPIGSPSATPGTAGRGVGAGGVAPIGSPTAIPGTAGTLGSAGMMPGRGANAFGATAGGAGSGATNAYSRSGVGAALPGGGIRAGGVGTMGGVGGTGGVGGAGTAGSSNVQDADNSRRAGTVGTGGHTPLAHTSSAGGNRTQAAAGPLMGGGVGRGAGNQERKRDGVVRSVTSSVEREGNMRDLLGEPKPVVAGVIGDWVRDEPTSR